MISHLYSFKTLLVIFFLTSCTSKIPLASEIPQKLPEGEELIHTQEMLALSMISYTGELLKGSDHNVEAVLGPCLENQLEYQPLTQNNWQLVWGPAVYKFALAELDDNMMFVVKHKQRKDDYTIVIRGTNGKAILDWIKEDLKVITTKPWVHGNPDSSLLPRISKSISIGLEILKELKPSEGILGHDLTIDQFLKKVTDDAEKTNVHVTGHSLAGALSPTLTLWLADTQETWDPLSKAQLDVYAFAGPTAGNEDFAEYSDLRIGDVTHRIYNPYDIVPKAWSIDTLEQIPTLYSAVLKFPESLKVLLFALKKATTDIHYTQIVSQAAPIPGVLNKAKTEFSSQAGWQHVCGYQCGLKIRDEFLETPSECKESSGKLACDACP